MSTPWELLGTSLSYPDKRFSSVNRFFPCTTSVCVCLILPLTPSHDFTFCVRKRSEIKKNRPKKVLRLIRSGTRQVPPVCVLPFRRPPYDYPFGKCLCVFRLPVTVSRRHAPLTSRCNFDLLSSLDLNVPGQVLGVPLETGR